LKIKSLGFYARDNRWIEPSQLDIEFRRLLDVGFRALDIPNEETEQRKGRDFEFRDWIRRAYPWNAC
jgi:hypothetical protein